MNRRHFNRLAAAGTLSAAVAAMRSGPSHAELKELIVAEPNHQFGYLPLYVAMANGYFRDEGLAVKVFTVESGSGHTNMVLTRQAFAFIGGPEHNAYAKAQGAELRAVVNIVNKGNVYLVAREGMRPGDRDFAAFVKGKRVTTGPFGGTPNSITRFLLASWGIDLKSSTPLSELTIAGELAAMKTRNADIASLAEPIVTQGIRQKLWEEPFFNVPRELGDYAYSTINVRKETIDSDAATVAAFVRAMIKGLRYTYEMPRGAADIAKKEFPTMALEDLMATLERCFSDGVWSRDGRVSPAAWATASRVVRSAELLKTDVAYEEIIDMRFVR